MQVKKEKKRKKKEKQTQHYNFSLLFKRRAKTSCLHVTTITNKSQVFMTVRCWIWGVMPFLAPGQHWDVLTQETCHTGSDPAFIFLLEIQIQPSFVAVKGNKMLVNNILVSRFILVKENSIFVYLDVWQWKRWGAFTLRLIQLHSLASGVRWNGLIKNLPLYNKFFTDKKQLLKSSKGE